MNKFLLSVIASGSLLFCTATTLAEPPNLGLLKKEARTYHDSGLYEKELSQVILQAQNYMLKQAASNAKSYQPQKLALVLDIDETSLSNYNKLAKYDFATNGCPFSKIIRAADSPAIQPTLTLFKKAHQQGIAVFFVTGRRQAEFAATQTNLLAAGYKDWAGLYLRPDDYKQASIIPFKTEARKSITEQGYTILASIGDQYSDIKGGYSQRGFKLPNPYYYLP